MTQTPSAALPIEKPDVDITSVSTERCVFRPAKKYSRSAHIKSLAAYRRMHNESIKRPEKFWARIGHEEVWFVTPKAGVSVDGNLKDELIAKIASDIRSFAQPQPQDIRLTDSLPNARTGKMMRRLSVGWMLDHSQTPDLPSLRTQNRFL